MAMNRIKQGVLKLFEKIDNLVKSAKRYSFFVLQIIGWVLLLYFITIGFAASFTAVFSKNASLSDFVLFITAAFILAYTYEAKKLKDETVFQRKMSAANDIQFRMTGCYIINRPDSTTFGKLRTAEVLNNVSKFAFLKAIPMRDIGHSAPFIKITDDRKFLEANYFISTKEDREAFLKALQLRNGDIKAWVLITNGTQFIYTFRAVGDGWNRTLQGSPNLNDQFILVKKELYEG